MILNEFKNNTKTLLMCAHNNTHTHTHTHIHTHTHTHTHTLTEREKEGREGGHTRGGESILI